MASPLAVVLVGLVAGIAGGMFGIGGGAIMVPALALLLSFPQKEATGTSLAAQVLPVALLGAVAYWKEGNVRLDAAWMLAGGLLVGNLIGALFTNQPFVSDAAIKKAYGVFMLLIGLRYLFDDVIKSMVAAKSAAGS